MFDNESPLDLASPAVRMRFVEALDELDRRLPLDVPSAVGNARATAGELDSNDPADPGTVVGRADLADAAVADEAVRVATTARAAWIAAGADARAEILRRAADAVLEERAALAALMVRESGKPWDEADGEVVEAVDFLRFYAAALEDPPGGLALPSDFHEPNYVRLVPRGVTVAITPWNFPFAIPMGIVAAALAGGNPVVLKPAEQTPACGAAVVRVLRAAGVPRQALGLVQGGARAGAALAQHPQVATIGFTGSVGVGLELARTAGHTSPSQRHIKRLVAELGGKNCAIVAADADLDAAAEALMQSAFSFAGQKCSAISRVLVEAKVADALSERLANAVSRLRVSPGHDFATFVPPVIDSDAQDRLGRAREMAATAGTVVSTTQPPAGSGYYVSPTLVADLPPDAPMVTDELFGPLLTIERIEDVAEGCSRVDALTRALVGGLYTSSAVTIERVLGYSPVGNLYINRPTVGARVGRQPFAGRACRALATSPEVLST